MKIQLQIDDDLLQEALELGKHKSQTVLIEEALKQYIKYHKQLKLLGISGTIECNANSQMSKIISKPALAGTQPFEFMGTPEESGLPADEWDMEHDCSLMTIDQNILAYPYVKLI